MEDVVNDWYAGSTYGSPGGDGGPRGEGGPRGMGGPLDGAVSSGWYPSVISKTKLKYF